MHRSLPHVGFIGRCLCRGYLLPQSSRAVHFLRPSLLLKTSRATLSCTSARLGGRNFVQNHDDLDDFDDFDDYDRMPPMSRHSQDGFRQQQRTPMDTSFGDDLAAVDWGTGDALTDLTKNVGKSLGLADSKEDKEYLSSHSITAYGTDIPRLCRDFESLFEYSQLPDKVLDYLKQNYDEPLPIQSICWPIALSGRDLVGIGQTGSGKTLAYVLPALANIAGQPQPETPRNAAAAPMVLVMAPTRELAQQIQAVFEEYGKLMNFTSVCLCGGSDRNRQVHALRNGVHVAVATPGRLIDLLRSGDVNLRRTGYVGIDEADRMFDMGFEWQIRKIMGQCRPDRQILMWSATWPQEIKNMVSDYLKDHVHVTVGSQELRANPNIRQSFILCDSRSKPGLLIDTVRKHLAENKNGKILVFAQTRDRCMAIRDAFSRRGIRTFDFHSGRSQAQREFVLQEYRSDRVKVLVATDVASRGLDISDITAVINYDLPNVAEDYVHRIGRTGRVNNKGDAYSLIGERPDDVRMAAALVKMFKETGAEVPEELLQAQEQHFEQRAEKRGRNQRRIRGLW